jgi:hypothetical protein
MSNAFINPIPVPTAISTNPAALAASLPSLNNPPNAWIAPCDALKNSFLAAVLASSAAIISSELFLALAAKSSSAFFPSATLLACKASSLSTTS